jgi:hypothetical protein
MPALSGSDGLVTDVGVDLVSELGAVEAERQAVGDYAVEQFRGGDAFEVVVVGGEGLEDGVAHDGSLFGEDGTEAMFFELVLFSAEVGVEPDREDACADQDATEFGEWEQAVPGGCVLDAMAEGDESCSSYDQQDHAEEGLGLS